MASRHPASTVRIVDGVALTERASDEPRHQTPLVFVHGGAHGAWAWAEMQPWFAGRGWSSVALDWLSHGDSRQLPHDEWMQRGIPEVAGEIGTACMAAGGRAVVIGHSMGGLASLMFAAAHPEAVAALVLLAPVVPGAFAGAAIDMPLEMDTPWLVPPPDVARQLFYSEVDDETAAAYYARLQPESPRAVYQATRWTVDLDLASFKVPTFAVAAERDLLVPAADVQALASEIGATALTLPGGHGVELEPGWPDLASQMDMWLSGVVG